MVFFPDGYSEMKWKYVLSSGEGGWVGGWVVLLGLPFEASCTMIAHSPWWILP